MVNNSFTSIKYICTWWRQHRVLRLRVGTKHRRRKPKHTSSSNPLQLHAKLSWAFCGPFSVCLAGLQPSQAVTVTHCTSTEAQPLFGFVLGLSRGAGRGPPGETERCVYASWERLCREGGQFGRLHCYRGIIKTTVASRPAPAQLQVTGENLCKQMTLKVARYGVMSEVFLLPEPCFALVFTSNFRLSS